MKVDDWGTYGPRRGNLSVAQKEERGSLGGSEGTGQQRTKTSPPEGYAAERE